MILGQCTQLLQDKKKQYIEWNVVITSYDPLILYRLIENTVLEQTEDQYPFATVYNQELGFYEFRQDTLSSPQCYERFNTKVDVGEAIGVTQQHKVLLGYVAQEIYTQTFSALTEAEQLVAREDAKERYLSCAFLRQSGTQHGNMKVDLQNDFTTETSDTPRTANILCTSSTIILRHLCKGRRSPKERHLCKAVEAIEAEEAGETEVEGEKNLSTNITGKISNVSIAIRRCIYP